MELLNQLVVNIMPAVPKYLVKRIASRYMAGITIQDVIEEVRGLNADGAAATIDILGEHSDNSAAARNTADEYIKVLDAIEREKLDSNISIKPTHLGLKAGYDLCRGLITDLVAHAAELNNFVRIDMEDHTCTDDSFRMYYEIRRDYENLGVVIQSYLRRSIRDIEGLKECKANVRICKGIYNEPRTIAYKDRDIIIRNFALLLEELLAAGCYVGIATHCEETIWHSREIIHRMKLEKDKYEFQMLLGVDQELSKILIDEGYRMRIYTPFGEEWYAYSTRRMKENPRLAGAVFREFVGIS